MNSRQAEATGAIPRRSWVRNSPAAQANFREVFRRRVWDAGLPASSFRLNPLVAQASCLCESHRLEACATISQERETRPLLHASSSLALLTWALVCLGGIPFAPTLLAAQSTNVGNLAGFRETCCPVSVRWPLTAEERQAAADQRLEIADRSKAEVAFPVQVDGDRVCGVRPVRIFAADKLSLRATPFVTQVRAQRNPATGQWEVTEDGRPVLTYNYQTNHPGEVLKSVSPGNLKYARARSDYIHPLYGLDGEILTKDWSVDHPHHRGIYWAWPEVDYGTNRGDLHALQRVFARPTGGCSGRSGPVFAQIEATNLWLWEDREPIVRERALIRVWHSGDLGRFVDLEFHFTALQPGVTVARRDTDKYGGLNVRLSAVKDQVIAEHTDPVGASPRMAWAQLSGIFLGGSAPSTLAIFQDQTNPDYPGAWVKYPELNWLQPTFPATGTRYALRRGQVLMLRYQLWIHRGGPATDEVCTALWQAADRNPPLD